MLQKIVLHYTKLERPAKDIHSSLLSPFLSYKENLLHYTMLERPAKDKHSILSPFINYKEDLCYITLSWQGLQGTNTLASVGSFLSDKENKVL
jgi:hypothetical protein